jgi:hypothetical protein
MVVTAKCTVVWDVICCNTVEIGRRDYMVPSSSGCKSLGDETNIFV